MYAICVAHWESPSKICVAYRTQQPRSSHSATKKSSRSCLATTSRSTVISSRSSTWYGFNKPMHSCTLRRCPSDTRCIRLHRIRKAARQEQVTCRSTRRIFTRWAYQVRSMSRSSTSLWRRAGSMPLTPYTFQSKGTSSANAIRLKLKIMSTSAVSLHPPNKSYLFRSANPL